MILKGISPDGICEKIGICPKVLASTANRGCPTCGHLVQIVQMGVAYNVPRENMKKTINYVCGLHSKHREVGILVLTLRTGISCLIGYFDLSFCSVLSSLITWMRSSRCWRLARVLDRSVRCRVDALPGKSVKCSSALKSRVAMVPVRCARPSSPTLLIS